MCSSRRDTVTYVSLDSKCTPIRICESVCYSRFQALVMLLKTPCHLQVLLSNTATRRSQSWFPGAELCLQSFGTKLATCAWSPQAVLFHVGLKTCSYKDRHGSEEYGLGFWNCMAEGVGIHTHGWEDSAPKRHCPPWPSCLRHS